MRRRGEKIEVRGCGVGVWRGRGSWGWAGGGENRGWWEAFGVGFEALHLLPTEEKGVFGVWIIPVAILLSCQDMKAVEL